MTKQLYDCYQQVARKFVGVTSPSVQREKLEALQILFLVLPPLNRFLLKKLVKLLAVVADDANNKMDAFNLAVVFAPNFICSQDASGLPQLKDVEPLTDQLKFIIENSSKIFNIPLDFLKKAADATDATTFCERVDSSAYRSIVKKNTDEEITLLYAQMVQMPDSKLKSEFMGKFQQCYPGTPVYVPKSVRSSAEMLNAIWSNT